MTSINLTEREYKRKKTDIKQADSHIFWNKKHFVYLHWKTTYVAETSKLFIQYAKAKLALLKTDLTIYYSIFILLHFKNGNDNNKKYVYLFIQLLIV